MTDRKLWSVRLNADAINREIMDQPCLVRGLVYILCANVFQTGDIPETQRVYRICHCVTENEKLSADEALVILHRLAPEILEKRAVTLRQAGINAENGKKGGRPLKTQRVSETITETESETKPAGKANDLTNNEYKKTKTNMSISSTVLAIWDHWKTVMHKPRSKLDNKRKKIIERALSQYEQADLLAAIDGCAGSKWHQGENDRHTAYNGIELILRDAAHIEQFLTIAQPKTLETDKTPTEALDWANDTERLECIEQYTVRRLGDAPDAPNGVISTQQWRWQEFLPFTAFVQRYRSGGIIRVEKPKIVQRPKASGE